MSAYYDLFEKPDVRQTGEQQPLYARFMPKGTIGRKEFIDRVHLFTGLSRSLLEGAMAAFMDELRDCLADGWTVELGELGYFTPSLNCHREVMEKKELRAASIGLRGLNFRLGKGFYKELKKKMELERSPQSASTPTSPVAPSLTLEQRFQLVDDYLRQYPCINRAQYARLAGRSYKQAVNDLNLFIESGLLMRHGAGRNVVYVRGKDGE
ncbi:MAG: DNA-binding protein [Bacteroides sp.]|uniref:HU family DNA-binding protein n=1 Tax=Bacteroides sp. TaxID=29523 RepID=UPI0025B7B1EC|nr:DNA-binding protein [Bacteroides sp.]MBS6238034.1 DNA-binding protein [Bacteroides sp.]